MAFQSNISFYVKSTIPSTHVAGNTFLISNDFELDQPIETGGKEVSVKLRNGNQIERMVITATGGVATIIKCGLTQGDTVVESVGLKKQWTDGTLGIITAFAFDLIDKGGDIVLGNIGFGDTTKGGIIVNNLTTIQRLALSATNGTIVYDTYLGENFQYIAGAWSPISSGSTQPNASETVAGKVEIATQTQVNNGTAIGETGALLAVTPDKMKVKNDADILVANPTGEIKIWPASVAPTGFLICDGASLLRAGTYAPLFAVLGTTYGTADGTHFNIPNLKGKVIVGLNASETEFNTLGKTGGEKTHTLTIPEMPAHTHTQVVNITGLGGNGVPIYNQQLLNTGVTASTGGDGAHNNLQPYMALNYIIKY